MSRSQYSKEFKVEACKLVIESGQTAAQTARDLGVRENVLSRWVQKYREDPAGAFPGSGLKQVAGGDPRIRELERENQRLRMERDILKKAMAYFAEIPK